MFIRPLAALALALTAGLAARPAQAQERPVTWVFQCKYDGGSDGPSYWSPAFKVRTTAEHAPSEEVLEGWKAWLRANPGLRYDSAAHCSATGDGNLIELQEYTVPRPELRIERSKWMPDFATPYQLPREAYYYCHVPDERMQHELVTDLFKVPLPQNLNQYLGKMQHEHDVALTAQNIRRGSQTRCEVAAPEPYKAYTERLDGITHQRPVARFPWPGIDPTAAPDLVDDLVARAKFAKMRIGSAPAQAKAAPPPPKPKVAGPPPKPPALTVKADPTIEKSKQTAAENLQKTLQADAENKARRAALQAKADAEFQAKMKEFWAERRRQGRSQ